MSFKHYFREYMKTMQNKIDSFLHLIEEKQFKVLHITSDDGQEYSTGNYDPEKIDIKDFKGCIIYCEGKALLITEMGNHKLLDDDRVEELKQKYSRL